MTVWSVHVLREGQFNESSQKTPGGTDASSRRGWSDNRFHMTDLEVWCHRVPHVEGIVIPSLDTGWLDSFRYLLRGLIVSFRGLKT
jgi:hypothetical protein